MKSPPTLKATREELDVEIEVFRHLVIDSRTSPKVEGKARQSRERLNAMYQERPQLFTEEDVRFLNVMAGFLAERLEAHKPRVKHTPQRKRKGDALDHCWRCKTPVDERFTSTCEECSSKAFKWMVCPVCQACGCQRGNKTLM